MSTHKRQHFVPRMVLVRFCEPDGKFHVFNKRAHHLNVYRHTPDTNFFERHLYSAVLDSSPETSPLSLSSRKKKPSGAQPFSASPQRRLGKTLLRSMRRT